MKFFIKKINFLLKKEAQEFCSDIFYIRNNIVRWVKTLMSERYLIIGIIIGLVLHFIF
jgi:hypothetical protein